MATASAVKTAAFVSSGVASIAGVWLSLLTSPWLILIGVVSIVAAWQIPAGKNPYGYKGLGELICILLRACWTMVP